MKGNELGRNEWEREAGVRKKGPCAGPGLRGEGAGCERSCTPIVMPSRPPVQANPLHARSPILLTIAHCQPHLTDQETEAWVL